MATDRPAGPFLLTVFAALVAAFVAAPATARADTIKVDLTSNTTFDTANSTAFLDTSLGRIEAPASVGGVAGQELNFGDGSDGDFSDGPGGTGITVSGTTITFNTDVKSTYQFKSFTLSSGMTAKVTGSKPLTLRVQGAVTIAGTLSADGGAGGDNSNGPGTAGKGVASGGDGGAGGSGADANNTPASSGATKSSAAMGGSGGLDTSSANSDQGGGGGCNGQSGGDPNDAAKGGPANTGGNAGSCADNWSTIAGQLDTLFSNASAGGAGGGGGGAYIGTLPIPPNPASVDGAGGGGGGGAVRIVSAGKMQIDGVLSARGGAGGADITENSQADCGGGGGGGSGGILWIQSASSITGAGSLNVTGGAGGTDATCVANTGSGYPGGAGSRGIIRVETSTGTASLTGGLQPAGSADATQTIAPAANTTYVAVSQPVDFTSGRFSYTNVQETTGCGTDGTLNVSYEGSDDGKNFGSGVSAQNISQLDNAAYVRFKVEIKPTGANPPCLTGLQFDSNLTVIKDFSVGGGLACGTISGSQRIGGNRKSLTDALGDLLLLAFSLVFIRFKKRESS